ncbi:MAG: hypothetical protein JSW04_02650 [Desulfobacterales bacterium]|nr:MAG: hypothetical protein JSV38_10065 [Desulfobacterales bacterium]UCD90355.1 MAG: hypothetical protein JSW04_02650 [Desulfobacterales bacterium]
MLTEFLQPGGFYPIQMRNGFNVTQRCTSHVEKQFNINHKVKPDLAKLTYAVTEKSDKIATVTVSGKLH